jgi:hypothetical protein
MTFDNPTALDDAFDASHEAHNMLQKVIEEIDR